MTELLNIFDTIYIVSLIGFFWFVIKTSSKKKKTPRFNQDISYRSWKNKIKMWQLVTCIEKKEQGIIVLLESLEGNSKAEKAVPDLTAAEVNTEEI